MSGCNKCDDSRNYYDKDCGGCSDDYIEFTGNCILRKDRVFYFASIDFYCIKTNIAISIDTVEKSISAFVEEDPTYSGSTINNYERGNFILFQEDCTMFTPLTTTFGFFTDDTSFLKLPNQLDMTFLHKETPFFGSRTIDSTQITLFRRE